MIKAIPIIARREYFKVVRKKSFWAMVLLLPTFYIIVTVIAGESAKSVEKSVAKQAAGAQRIVVIDEARLISDSQIVAPLERSADLNNSTNAVRQGSVDAVFFYPADIASQQSVRVLVKDTGVLARSRFDALAQNLLRQSILEDIQDSSKVSLFNAKLVLEKTVYKGGIEVVQGIEGFLLPILAVVLYFLLVMFSTNYMLMSVSEEKENRMIETVLSLVQPRQLIWGKLVGLVGLAFTQLLVLTVFAVVSYSVSSTVLPLHIDWSKVHMTAGQVLLTASFIVSGFGFMASLMVGIGAAMPTYRDAQQASPLFIILSILPVYLSTALIAEPTGTLSRTLSYIPFMSPLVLTYRASAGALPPFEIALGLLASIAYLVIGMTLAFKLFEVGSLETGKRVSFRNAFQRK